MDLQERAKNVIVNTLMEMLNCRQDEVEMLTEEVLNNLGKSRFYIQYDWENDIN